MASVAMYSWLRPLVDAWMTLDSGLRRRALSGKGNDVPGIMPCPDIFEYRLLPNPCGIGRVAPKTRLEERQVGQRNRADGG